MSRSYTQEQISPLDNAKAEKINNEINGMYETFNGSLGQHQLPTGDITYDKFVAPAYSTGVITNDAGATNGIKTKMLTQTYYYTSKIGTGTFNPEMQQDPTEGLVGSIPAPIHTWNMTDGGWRAGWNSLNTYCNAGTYLAFDGEEGMLKGTLTIDTSIPMQATYGTKASGGALTEQNEAWGLDFSRRIGIFVNDVLVADTGFLTTCGRYSINLPFSTPIGSQPIVVDVRFIADIAEGIVDYAYMPRPLDTERKSGLFFRVFASQLTVRNEYR